MPLPETIPVKFTEEDAEYISVRPVKRQTFRLRELVDMVLCVTGRDLPRLQQILRTGTVVYHFYRYKWQGFDADPAELAQLLAEFPADFPEGDPCRVFQPNACTVALLESTVAGRAPVEIERAAAQKKPLFAARSFWDCLLSISASPPEYAGYSFARRGDLYRVALTPEQSASVSRAAARLAPRSLRAALEALGAPVRITFVCPRSSQPLRGTLSSSSQDT
ncbi:MAG TPA: hypothetical protein VN774_04995 [Candidatus Limnocylindrales bacterium]|nr:hypothetical protein [Candidatus Limnocylindrales bacterium]